MPTITQLLLHLWMAFWSQYVPVPFTAASGGGSSPTFVSAVSSVANTTGSTAIVSPSITVGAGQNIHVGCQTGDTTGVLTVSSVTDTLTNTFSAVGGLVTNPTFTPSTEQFVKYGSTGGSDVVTCNISGTTTYANVTVFITSGDTSSDATANGKTTTAGTTVTTGSFTPGQTTEISIACGMFNAFGSGIVAGSGYTVPSNGTDVTNGWGCEYQVTVTTSSQTASIGTGGVSKVGILSAATFKP